MLLRRGGRHRERGLEVLMLRRGLGARFMPGVWVFAGGVVDEADRDRAASEPLDGVDPDEWAHRICGARELEEEGGIEVDPATLLPWSRWVTPEPVPMRFDTRFYIGLAPAHSRPRHDEIEMDEARWIGAQEALDAGSAGTMEISFPTVRHLEMLAPHPDADAAIAAAAERTVEAILPQVTGSKESVSVHLPGEPGYVDP